MKPSQNILLGFLSGPKIYILKLFFFIPGPFQGGHFFGEIIYFSALDLKPATLNLRLARGHNLEETKWIG